MLLHATALVDVVNKSTIPAKDLNIDRDGDRHVGGTTFSVIISEDNNYNGEVTLLHEFRWTSSHKKDHPLRPPPSEAKNYLAELVYLAITTKGVRVSGVPLHCFTEHKHKGFIFCVHPNYWCKGPSMTGYTTSTGRWVFEGNWRFQHRFGVLWTSGLQSWLVGLMARNVIFKIIWGAGWVTMVFTLSAHPCMRSLCL